MKLRRRVLAALLFVLSRPARRRARVRIGITGSVGKTTTRILLGAALAGPNLRETSGNNNTPIGLCLGCLGLRAPRGGGLLAWAGLLFRAAGRCVVDCMQLHQKNLVFVAEMGVDRPGDAAGLLGVFRPSVMLFCPAAPVHIGAGQFAGLAEIMAEKAQFARHAQQVLLLGVNKIFEQHIRAAAPKSARLVLVAAPSARLVCTKSGLPATRVFLGAARPRGGRSAHTITADIPALLPPQVGAAAAAGAALARQFGGATPRQVARRFSALGGHFSGRGAVTQQNSITIWDHSYNASPRACAAVLAALPAAARAARALRRLAVLGPMEELGPKSPAHHARLAQLAAKHADVLVFIGPTRHPATRAFLAAAPAATHHFSSVSAAARALPALLKKGDFVLVKASRSAGLDGLLCK